MNRKFSIVFVLFFFCAFDSNAQQLAELINKGAFNKKAFTTALSDSINVFRSRHQLPILILNDKLKMAAAGHADCILKSGNPTTAEKSEDKSTPFKRAIKAGGLFGEVHEIVAGINLTKTVRMEISRRHLMINNQNQLIAYLMEKWQSDVTYKKILSNMNMYNFAIGVAVGHSDISISCDFASLAYIKPSKDLELHLDDYHLQPYSKEACAGIKKKYAYLDKLLTDNIELRNDTAFFQFHNLKLLKSALDKSTDGLAVDYVTPAQFPCGSGNRIFPSHLHNGYLFKPVYQSDLFGKNIYKEKNILFTPIAIIPNGIKIDSADEFTLYIIKDKHVCQKVYYNNLEVDNYVLNNINPVFDTLSATLTNDTVSKTLEFTIQFEKNKSTYNLADIKPFLDSIQVNRYAIRHISISAYSSVEGDSVNNMKLENKRAASIVKAINEYKLRNIPMDIGTSENWEGFFKSIKGSPYQNLFKGKTHQQIKAILASDTLDFNMEPYLREQRKADIKIVTHSILVDTTNIPKLIAQFKQAVETANIDVAKTVQPYIFHFIKEKKVSADILKNIDMPQKKAFVPLINNKKALIFKDNIKKLNDSLLHKYRSAFAMLLVLRPNYSPALFNERYLDLLLWQKDTASIKSPEALEKSIRDLYNSGVLNKKVDKLLLNYYMFAADYYYDHNNFQARDQCLKNIKERIVRPSMSPQTAYSVAQYFIYQTRIPWAIEVMYPYIKKKSYDKNFLFTFLRIAFYEPEIVPKKEYYDLLKVAAKKYPNRFCKMYHKPNMSFQHLSDPNIKQIYCKSCADKN